MRITTLIILLLSAHSSMSQIAWIVEKVAADTTLLSIKSHSFEPAERIIKLTELINPDSIRFSEPSSSIYDDEIYFYDLDTAGVYLIDLDDDKDLDLIYSAQSGSLGLMSTAIYFNQRGKLKLEKVIEGKMIDLCPSKRGVNLYVLWKPCCDSYTNRLEVYVMNKKEIKMQESFSYVGRSQLNHVPDFEKFPEKMSLKKGTVLYALKTDFKNVSPYFREDNKVFQKLLKEDQPIELMTLQDDTDVIPLGTIEYNSLTYYAVLTDAIDAPMSHYEWSEGENRRFIGWIVY